MVAIYTTEQIASFDKKISIAERNVKLAICANRDMIVKYRKIIEDFIRDKKLIVKGGLALNAALPNTNKIYDDDIILTSDYDILTYSPKIHTIELCNILFKAGIPYIDAWHNYREFVYSIKIGNYDVVDFVLFPYSMYNRIEIIVGSDKIKYVHPNFMRMYTHWIISNLSESNIIRARKELPRLKLIDKLYPYKEYNISPSSIITHKRSPMFVKLIEAISNKYIKDNKKILLCGYLAYNYYKLRSSSSSHNKTNSSKAAPYAPPHDYLDILTDTPQDAINAIKALLKAELGTNNNNNKYNEHVRIKKFNNFIDVIPIYYMITYEDVPLIMILSLNNDQCISYETSLAGSGSDGLNYVSFPYLMFYYQCITYLALLNKYIRHNSVSRVCIYNLFQWRKQFKYIIPRCMGKVGQHWLNWKKMKKAYGRPKNHGDKGQKEMRWQGYKPNDVTTLLVPGRKDKSNSKLQSGSFNMDISL
jgi:hypothetical protein